MFNDTESRMFKLKETKTQRIKDCDTKSF